MSSTPHEPDQPPATCPPNDPASSPPQPATGGPGPAGFGAPPPASPAGSMSAPPGAGYAPPGYGHPGYPGSTGPPPGYFGPGLHPPDAPSNATPIDPILVTAGIAVPFLLLLSLLIPEDGTFAFKSVPGWSLVAMLSALLLATGSFLAGPTGRQLRLAGAGGVILFWVLICLPEIRKNTALMATLATIAALFVVWQREKKP